MGLYEITLRPSGGLGTPLMGDTLFGQFCWQAAYDSELVNGGLEAQLPRYGERPFAVFSSAFPRFMEDGQVTYAFKRPDLPTGRLSPPLPGSDRLARLRHLKQVKSRRWLLVTEDLRLDFSRLVDDAQLTDRLLGHAPGEVQRLCKRAGACQPQVKLSQPHNTINRQSQTTGEAPFAPYAQQVHFFLPGIELVVFVFLDEEATDLDRICLGLTRMGRSGFGRDASIGLGRFELTSQREMPLPDPKDANAWYTLAPCVPVPHSYTDAFFTPFVRFGKHGDRLARSSNPFKNPVVMAAEGAVFVPSEPQPMSRPYFGQAVTGVSKVQDKAVVQGYAPCLPCRLEVPHE